MCVREQQSMLTYVKITLQKCKKDMKIVVCVRKQSYLCIVEKINNAKRSDAQGLILERFLVI